MNDEDKDEDITCNVEILRDKLEEGCTALTVERPVQGYVRELDALDSYAQYHRWPEGLHRWCKEVERTHGAPALERYHRLVMVALIEAFPARAAQVGIPPSVLELLGHYHAELVRDIDRERTGQHKYPSDRLFKDLAVCRLKLLPVGPELADLHSGVPRRILLQPPRSKALGRLTYFMGTVGGFKPMLETHMDRRLRMHFSPEGFEQSYRVVADLLEAHPHIKGLASATWWFDPVVARISPELAYLSEYPLANGARRFPSTTDDVSVKDAVRLSPVRRALYERGEYRPRCYSVVWSRDALLRWARSHSASSRG